MTQKQEYLRRGLLSKIHCHPGCKERKALEVWEDFLFSSYNVRSCSELSIDELYNLIDVMNGWAMPKIGGVRARAKSKKIVDKAKPYIPNPNEPLTEKQEACIRTMWNLTPDERGLIFIDGDFGKFVKKQTGEYIIYVHNLTITQANKIITGKQYVMGLKEHKKKEV
ncbi:MAG: hypothetical protein LBH45_07245 [Campylobacteraceae bacterium]|jgi:hypothetical protein|nr:hypothetical protein [Campylobacteraceae bacterium]